MSKTICEEAFHENREPSPTRLPARSRPSRRVEFSAPSAQVRTSPRNRAKSLESVFPRRFSRTGSRSARQRTVRHGATGNTRLDRSERRIRSVRPNTSSTITSATAARAHPGTCHTALTASAFVSPTPPIAEPILRPQRRRKRYDHQACDGGRRGPLTQPLHGSHRASASTMVNKHNDRPTQRRAFQASGRSVGSARMASTRQARVRPVTRGTGAFFHVEQTD